MSTINVESFPPEVLPLLERWRALSEAERGAIESSDWKSLKAAQTQKQRLQTDIDAILSRSARPMTTSSGSSTRALPPEVADLIKLLKRLEQENRDLLGQKLSVLRSGMANVNASVRHLRQVHQAYGHSTSGTWQSYS